ncbi:MAG: hypothetical protein R3Y24_05005 [Eubacteriales bacterium]
MEKQEKKKKQSLPTKGMLSIRILAGGYLIYSAYELFTGLEGAGARDLIIFIIAAIVFTVAGIILAIISVKAMMEGKYVGGSGDANELDEITHELDGFYGTEGSIEADSDSDETK